ncbi:MAG: heme NO-binding domain-containing protein [Desulfobacteraceae bacterium]|nr:heme NO-binding domain-containing protein [Desulfobacteraceae bacterium]
MKENGRRDHPSKNKNNNKQNNTLRPQASEFFDQIETIFKQTKLKDQARQIIIKECEENNIAPQDLTLENGAMIVLGFMTTAGEYLSPEEWGELDKQLKALVGTEKKHPIRGKVRGSILSATLQYTAHKGGQESLTRVKEQADLEHEIHSETWYPLSVHHDLLTAIETRMGTKQGNRFKDIGKYLLTQRTMTETKHWFENHNRSILQIMQNMQEILQLNSFLISTETPAETTIQYEGASSPPIQDFITGICQGILELHKTKATITMGEGEAEDTSKITIAVNTQGAAK